MSKFANYNEELGINCIDDQEVYATKEKMKKYIPSLEDKDLDNFVIVKSKLLYVGTDEKETEITSRLGIGGSSDSSDAGATVKEIQSIVDGVVDVSEENKENIPSSDTDRVNEPEHTNDQDGLIGTRLFDRRGVNLTNGNWNILIEYNSQNKEIARYGSGYYWLKKGQQYTIKGEEIDFKNDYVINYKDGEFTVLSGRAVNWNVNATLGVPDEIVDGRHTLVLNLDPMSLENGKWEDKGFIDEKTNEKYDDFIVENTDGTEIISGIRKTGDVEYDVESKSLLFNENSEINPSGEGGKIALIDKIADLSTGFTFEFYGNMSRGLYNSTKIPNGTKRLGIFCQTNSLNLISPSAGMRFFFQQDGNVLDLKGEKTYNDDWKFIEHHGSDATHVTVQGFKEFSDYGFDLNEDFYLTVSIIMEDENDRVMDSDEWARLEYYINGEKLGYCYHDEKEFAKREREYYDDKYYFVVGCSLIFDPLDMYYYKGKCYGCRLYNIGLTPDQVKLNYDMTLKYRDSFKDEVIE